MPGQTHINGLPVELFSLIFSYLDEASLSAVKDVSKLWRARAGGLSSKFHFGERIVAENLFRSVIEPHYKITSFEDLNEGEMFYRVFDAQLFLFHFIKNEDQLTIEVSVQDLATREEIEHYFYQGIDFNKGIKKRERYRMTNHVMAKTISPSANISNDYISISGSDGSIIIQRRSNAKIRELIDRPSACPFLLHSDENFFEISHLQTPQICIKKYDRDLNEIELDLTKFNAICVSHSFKCRSLLNAIPIEGKSDYLGTHDRCYNPETHEKKLFVLDRFMIFDMVLPGYKRSVLILNIETGTVQILKNYSNSIGKMIDGKPYLLVKKQKSNQIKIINLVTQKPENSIKLNKNLSIHRIKWDQNSILILMVNKSKERFSIFSWDGESKKEELLAFVDKTIKKRSILDFWFIGEALVFDRGGCWNRAKYLDVYKKSQGAGFTYQGPIVLAKELPFKFNPYLHVFYYRGVFIGQPKKNLSPTILDFTYKFSDSPEVGEGKGEPEKGLDDS